MLLSADRSQPRVDGRLLDEFLELVRHTTPLSVRSSLARALSSDEVGRLVELVTRDRVPNGGIVFDTSPTGFSRSVKAAMLFGVYESAEIRFIRAFLRSDLDVVELGAGVGVTGAHILDVISPERTLTCVEANPFLIQSLTHTLETVAARRGQTVTIVNGIVSSSGGTDSVCDGTLRLAGSHLASRVVECNEADPTATATADVPIVVLSSLVSGLDRYALVVDIEGAESTLLAQQQDALAGAEQIVIELHPSRYGERAVSVSDLVASFVNDLGFRVLDRNGPVLAFSR